MTYVSGDSPPGDKLAVVSFDLTLQGIKDTTRKTKNYTLNKIRRCSFTIYDPKEKPVRNICQNRVWTGFIYIE